MDERDNFLIKCYDTDNRKVKYNDVLMHLEMQGQGYQAYIIRDKNSS